MSAGYPPKERVFTMASIEDNYNYWELDYDWRNKGEEWSIWWGSSAKQWEFTVYPRIQQFLPCERILEIGPGFGRWTQYLARDCTELIGVDISMKCVDACRSRFQRDRRVKVFLNDGHSLDVVDDRSLDVVFSFDSLVHVDKDVIDRYLQQLPRKVRPGGVCFIHHSNLEHYKDRLDPIPNPARELWRSRTVSATVVRNLCGHYGLSCLRQEMVNWSFSPILLDCFTTIVVGGEREVAVDAPIENWCFMDEAKEAIKTI